MAASRGSRTFELTTEDDTVLGAAAGSAITVLAGDGDDLLYGGTAGDLLYGGSNNDRVFGNAGADTLDGGVGSDELYGGAGEDLVQGGGNTGNADRGLWRRRQ